jgi:hypothetical protein
VDQRLLLAQQFEHGLVLGFGQFVRVLDAQFRLGRFQVQRRVGDVDRTIGLHAALVRLAVGQVCGSNTTPQLVGACLKTLVLYSSTFGPHWYGVP